MLVYSEDELSIRILLYMGVTRNREASSLFSFSLVEHSGRKKDFGFCCAYFLFRFGLFCSISIGLGLFSRVIHRSGQHGNTCSSLNECGFFSLFFPNNYFVGWDSGFSLSRCWEIYWGLVCFAAILFVLQGTGREGSNHGIEEWFGHQRNSALCGSVSQYQIGEDKSGRARQIPTYGIFFPIPILFSKSRKFIYSDCIMCVHVYVHILGYTLLQTKNMCPRNKV